MQEPKNEYSHLDPALSPPLPANLEEEEEEDIYEDLGDLETHDLMQFAYQIATGMVRVFHWMMVGLSSGETYVCYVDVQSDLEPSYVLLHQPFTILL